MTDKKIVNVRFDEHKIVDALLILIKLTKNTDEKFTQEDVVMLAVQIFGSAIRSIMDALKHDLSGPLIIQELINRTELGNLIDKETVH